MATTEDMDTAQRQYICWNMMLDKIQTMTLPTTEGEMIKLREATNIKTKMRETLNTIERLYGLGFQPSKECLEQIKNGDMMHQAYHRAKQQIETQERIDSLFHRLVYRRRILADYKMLLTMNSSSDYLKSVSNIVEEEIKKKSEKLFALCKDGAKVSEECRQLLLTAGMNAYMGEYGDLQYVHVEPVIAPISRIGRSDLNTAVATVANIKKRIIEMRCNAQISGNQSEVFRTELDLLHKILTGNQ